MISTSSKLAMALGVIGAIALSVPSAEASSKRSTTTKVHRTATPADAYVRQPSFRGAYNYMAPPSGGGINFNDGRSGANYNPNQ